VLAALEDEGKVTGDVCEHEVSLNNVDVQSNEVTSMPGMLTFEHWFLKFVQRFLQTGKMPLLGTHETHPIPH